MKKEAYLFFLIATMIISGCSKEEEKIADHIENTWTLKI